MDETELSFIRCPNCRSLVPAVASRCRMCGFVLKDAASQANPPKAPIERSIQAAEIPTSVEPPNGSAPSFDDSAERPSRVRQRTISVSGNTQSIIESHTNVEAAAPQPVVQKVEPVRADPVTQQAARAEVISKPAPIEEEFDAEDEEFSDDAYPGDDEDQADAAGAGWSEGSPDPAAVTADVVRKKRRRRRKKKRPDLQVPPQSPAESIPSSQQVTPGPVHAPAPQVLQPEPEVEPHQEGYTPWRSPTPSAAPGFRVSAAKEPVRALEPQRSEPIELRNPIPAPRPAPKLAPKQAVNGALMGWLVSYAEDPRGVAREIREGRFFVGRDQLRPSDFVIDHSTVSTPQCLVVCDPVAGVSIQDLMSEGGTNVTRGSRELDNHSDQVHLENGDRVRFGEYEMLFVKLP